MPDPDAPMRAPGGGPQLETRGLAVGFRGGRPVARSIDLCIAPGRITALIGANGSGKSTLLRTLGSALVPLAGQVLLDGSPTHTLPRRRLARTISMLPQQPVAPEGITVRALAAFGRHPLRRLLSRERSEDREAVDRALAAARMTGLAARALEELSGGQRQRAWIAMAIAQEAPLMLLDEPTTALDVAHQLEVLDLLAELNRTRGTTVVMVLHDLNHAAHYAHRIVALHGGRIHAEGPPEGVLTADLVREVFAVDAAVRSHPVTHAPLVLPLPRSPYAANTLIEVPGEGARQEW